MTEFDSKDYLKKAFRTYGFMTTNGSVDTWELEKAYRAVIELQAVRSRL